MLSPSELALEFVKRINAHDPDLIAELMSDDHVFVDSLGLSVAGREAMRAGWQSYFKSFPDYKITPADMLQQGHIIALFGSASGTLAVNGDLRPENAWEIPAAWKVITGGGFVVQWHVFADLEPVRRIIAANA